MTTIQQYNKGFLIGLGVCLILFCIFLFLILSNFFPATTTDSSISQPSPTPVTTSNHYHEEDPGDSHSREGLRKQEQLTQGTTKYTYTSPRSGRNNEVHTNTDGVKVFERAVLPDDSQSTITDYTTLFGQPERVSTGSRFYGNEAQTYIYAQQGIAFIANPQTQRIYELHTFQPMSISDYIQGYGEDITAP